MKYFVQILLYTVFLSVVLHAVTEKTALSETASQKTIDVTKKAATQLAKETKEAATVLRKSAQKVFEKAQKSIADIVVAESVSPTGKELYQKCKTCHGEHGEKRASSESDIIAGQSVNTLIEKLKRYQEIDRNMTDMGTVMREQVKDLSESQVLAVAAYIGTLNNKKEMHD